MDEHDSVRLITPPMGRALGAAFVRAIPDDVPFEVGNAYISDQNLVDKRVREILVPPTPTTVITSADEFGEKLAYNENFWRRLFPTEAFDFDPAKMLIWPRRPGHDRLLVTPKGLWGNKLYDKCDERFEGCWRYTDDLDKMIHLSGSPYVATARWFRDRQEADEELANKSALQLAQLLIAGITLPERELYELMYFEETEDHLDKNNVTLISGSRNPDGNVPRARWRDGEFRLGDYGPGSARGDLRARGV